MKKSRKRNAIVLALIVLLIATAIGYAAFASTLNITGSATANGKWDVHFANATISKNDDDNSVEIQDGDGQPATTGEKLDIAVTLTYPGDTATVTVDVVNASSCAANLTGFTVTAEDDGGTTLNPTNNVWTDGVLQMQLNTANFTANSTTIASGASQTYTMTFTWVDDGETNEADITANIGIEMNFAQPNS